MELTFRSCLLDEQTGKLQLNTQRPDVFEVFGLKHAYSYDSDLLEERYLELSKLTHPDHHRVADEESKQRTIKISAWVNQSYKELKDSLFRAEFLLNMIEKDNGLKTDSKKLPGTFLMDMLELQEELEILAVKLDESRLEEIEYQAEKFRKRSLKEVGEGLDLCLSRSTVDADFMQELRSQLNTVRYYDRILGTVEELLDKI